MTAKSQSKPRACGGYADRLVDFSDGELAADERQAVASHVASCPGCRAELARLDRSLTRLTNGISTTKVALRPRAGSVPVSRIRRAAYWTATAAAVLICLAGAWWIGGLRSARQLPHVRPPNEVIGSQRITERDALWQIAIIEQQARLRTSLDLWPSDESFDDQRRQDERLLTKFQSLTEAALSGAVQ